MAARATLNRTSNVATRMTSSAMASINVIAGSLTVVSHSFIHSPRAIVEAAARRLFSYAAAGSVRLLQRTFMPDHAERRRDPEQQQEHSHDEHQRYGKDALGMNQAGGFQSFALLAQAPHEQQMIDDPEDQHADAEQDQRLPEVACRCDALEDTSISQLVEKLVDGEAETDERKRRTDHGHQRAIGSHARALKRQAGAAHRQIRRDGCGGCGGAV